MQPQIELTKFEDGGDLEFAVTVEVMPDIPEVDFTSIKLEKLVSEVADETVEETIQNLANQQKSFATAEEGTKAALGDAALVDFEGRIDGEPFDGGTAQDHQLELGSGSFIPGFEEQLVGAVAGDTPTIKVSFPAEYPAEELAGKEAEFSVTVKEIKTALPTAVDDGMAARLGMESIDDLRKVVRGQAEEELNMATRLRLKRSLLDALADMYEFSVPVPMLEEEFEQIWKQLEAEMEADGATFDDAEQSEDDLRAEYRSISERRVRLGLVLSEVGRVNNVQVTQEEVNQRLAAEARRYPGQEQKVFEHYQQNPEAMAQLQAPIFEDKVVDFVLELAQVNERKVSQEELMRDPEDDEAPAAKKKTKTATAKPAAGKKKKASAKPKAEKADNKPAAKKKPVAKKKKDS